MTWTEAAGLFNLGFGLFHLAFWRLLNWKEELPRLSKTNRAVMQTLNLCLTFCFLLAAYLYLAYPADLAAPGLGRAVSIGAAAFWALRAVLQVVLFDLRRRVHQVLMALFVLGILIHGAAVLA